MSQQDESRDETQGLTVEDAPNEADVHFVEERIDAYNIAATGYDDYRPLTLFVRDDQGAIIAGLTGFTWGGTLKVEFFWVHEDLRGQGYGSRLMDAAEREAVARGCRQSVLDTHSFQAPDFYPKLGYVRCGLAEDWPLGHQQIYFQKRLQ
ncbi:MAG TPA: GNAT family N-acetyltransferase [Ktedonobacterales bacterium]|jgi:GNAT superfamily N-acetyltransferase|nr:GNAT family N-acetyltransferase [Ktedonobacterales bacterium]